MQYAYRADAWHDLYICLGGASAALAGLIFVALSLHLSAIMGNPVWRARALGSLLFLLSILLVSALILIPGQPRTALSIELMLYGAFLLAWALRVQVRVMRGVRTTGAALFLRWVLFGGTGAMVVAFFTYVTFQCWRLAVGIAEETDGVAESIV